MTPLPGSARRRVCFPFVGDSVGGSQISAAALIAGLRGSRYEPLVVVHRDGPLQDYLRQQDIAFEPLSLPTFVGSGSQMTDHLGAFLRTTPRLAGYLRRREVAIVHTQDGRMNQTWGLPARLSGSHSIWHQRSMYAPSRLTHLTLRVSNRVLCNSAFVRDGLPAAVRDKAIVVPNPVPRDPDDTDREAARRICLQAIGAGDDARLVAFIGNFTRQKRPDIFLAVAGQLTRELGSGVHFLVFGRDRDQLQSELEAQAGALGIADRLHFMGFRNPIQAWLAGADLLLSPEVEDAFGRTLVEAMLVGTPVVASDSGGHREIVRDGETGFLTAVDDVDAMSTAARELLRNPASAARIAGTARNWADGRFSLDAHVGAITAIYDDLLAPR